MSKVVLQMLFVVSSEEALICKRRTTARILVLKGLDVHQLAKLFRSVGLLKLWDCYISIWNFLQNWSCLLIHLFYGTVRE
jgi:hypothetical protein